ncbi:uncharacterized protein BDV17DRAFT_280381 [Aspergillus undulatus]|uniref:uncharacterized protein n=1 Tax=Aspergillus undulatus TaxID=1810928 RepID=UPI003CCD586F
MSIPCPFRISRPASDRLARNEAFRVIRENLRRQELGSQAPSFCSSHRYSCSHEAQESFRLHRDIIHTLLLPLFLLHNRASRVADSILPSHKRAESERVFRGEARDAYTWLHCIFSEEHDWYLTERCPACIVLHVLHSEPTIRFVAVACLLSDELLNPGLLNSGRRLPKFDFWMEALETAVSEDPFWGPECWPDIEARACSLIEGIQILALQCMEFQAALDHRQCLQSTISYKANCRFQREVAQALPAHSTPLSSPDCLQSLGKPDDSKQRSPTQPNAGKQFYSTSSPFEARIGYYRAVRHGQHIFVSGTTAVDPASPAQAPQILFPDDARQQTRVALRECIKAVQALGGKGPENVVRVRMFVSRSEDCIAVGEGFTEVLGRNSQPGVGAAATMLVVRDGFVDERMLVEIEVDAMLE